MKSLIETPTCHAQALIDRITTLEARLERRRKHFNTYSLTTTQPYVVDFQNRLHLYVMPSVAVNFSAEDMGTIFIPAGRWTEIYSWEGSKWTPHTSITLFVLATDEPIQLQAPSSYVESQNYIAAAAAAPTTTTAGTDTTYTFSTYVNELTLQNNTNANANFAIDTAASAGSPLLLPGTTLILTKRCLAVHWLTAAQQNINGTTAANLVCLGSL